MWHCSRPSWLHQQGLQEGEVSSGDRSILDFILKTVMYVCQSIRECVDMLVKTNCSGKDVSPWIMLYGPCSLKVPIGKFFDLCHIHLFLSFLHDPSAWCCPSAPSLCCVICLNGIIFFSYPLQPFPLHPSAFLILAFAKQSEIFSILSSYVSYNFILL